MDMLPLWPEEGKQDDRPNAKYTHTCELCGKTFVRPYKLHQRFCSAACGARARAGLPPDGFRCIQCGKAFTRWAADQKYCTASCYADSMREPPSARICPVCGKQFTTPKKSDRRVHCSPRCASASPSVVAKRRAKMQGRCVAPPTPQSRQRMSEARKRMWADPEFARIHTEQIRRRFKKPADHHGRATCPTCGVIFVRPRSNSQYCSRICGLRAHPENERRVVKESALETKVAAVLDRLGIAYQRQYPLLFWRADFYLPERNAILETQGCYWHGCSECGFPRGRNWANDKRKKAYVLARGMAFIEVWEHDLKVDVEAAVGRALAL